MPRLIMVINNQSVPFDIITYLEMVAVSRLQVLRGRLQEQDNSSETNTSLEFWIILRLGFGVGFLNFGLWTSFGDE